MSKSSLTAKSKASRGSQGPKKRSRTTTARRPPGIEHKFLDSGAVELIPPMSGGMSGGRINPSPAAVISCPPQGDFAQNRDGKRIVIDTVIIEGIVNWAAYDDAIAPGKQPNMFIALVQDTQTNGANMPTELAFSNATGLDAMCIAPQKNLYNATRFKTLKIWEIPRPPQSMSQHFDITDIYIIQAMTSKFSCYLNVDIPVNFNQTTPTVQTVASVVDNSLHMIAFQDTSHVKLRGLVSYNARIRYVG